MPPTAPARRNTAVRRGLRNRITTAAPSVSPLLRLTVKMLLPLPGSSGHRMEQRPMSSPAAAIAGISTQDFMRVAGRARAMMWLNANPDAERQRRQHERESRQQIGQLGIRPVQRRGLMSDR